MIRYILCHSSQISDIGTLIVATIAVGFSIGAWSLSKRTYRNQIINDLHKEYASNEIGSALQRIWDLKRECDKEAKDTILHVSPEMKNHWYITGNDKESDTEKYSTQLLIHKYVKIYKKERKKIDIEKTLHFQRRRISIFYQNISAIAVKDRYYRAFLWQTWKLGDFNTIKILEPLEMIANAICLQSKIHQWSDPYPEYMVNMLKLVKEKHKKEKNTNWNTKIKNSKLSRLVSIFTVKKLNSK